MKYCKFIDENYIEIYRKPYVYVDGRQISNPSAEVLFKAGIKPLEIEEIPKHDMQTQYAVPYYIDGEPKVTQKWKIADIPEGVIDDADA